MKTGKEFTITTDNHLSLKTMLKSGHYDEEFTHGELDNAKIAKFPDGQIRCQLFHYYNHITHQFMERDMVKEGYRPATVFELLALGAKRPELQKMFDIFALGTKIKWGDSALKIFCLSSDQVKKRRSVSFERYGPPISFQPRYLGIRINRNSPIPLIDLSQGDWFPLPEDLEFLNAKFSPSGLPLIDMDHYPFMPAGRFNPYQLIEHRKAGMFEFNPSLIRLVNSQASDETYQQFLDRLDAKKLLLANSNLLDYWLKYPHLIPESCRKEELIFFGTIIKNDNSMHLTRTLKVYADGCKAKKQILCEPVTYRAKAVVLMIPELLPNQSARL